MKSVFSIFFITVLLTCSCMEQQFYDIEETLASAGDNRIELEKFIEHFKDSGKLAYTSCCFLISNMRFHNSKDMITADNKYEDFFTKTDTIIRNILDEKKKNHDFDKKEYESLRNDLRIEFDSIPEPHIKYNIRKPDVQILTSEFLIRHLNHALKTWQANKYDYRRDFEFFKEFLLPYRTTNEYPYWNAHEIYEHIQLPYNGNVHDRIAYYKSYVETSRWLNKYCVPHEHLGIFDIYVPKFKMDCHNMTNWSCDILRANGIPTVYEFTPLWKDRSSRHFWCVSPDSTGLLQPYTAPDNNIREDWETDIKYVSN